MAGSSSRRSSKSIDAPTPSLQRHQLNEIDDHPSAITDSNTMTLVALACETAYRLCSKPLRVFGKSSTIRAGSSIV